jgi:hypothetical protein
MAARYVNPQNVVAQGLSFYTGLVPGSYEQGGGAGGKNVMGAGHGGSAGIGADRTASDAAVKSIKNYAPGGSIFKPKTSELASNTAALKANTAGGSPGGGQPSSAGAKPSGGGTPGATGATGPGGFAPDSLAARMRASVNVPPRPTPAAPPPHSALTARGRSGASPVSPTRPAHPHLGRKDGGASPMVSRHGPGKVPPGPVTHDPSVGGWNPAKSSNAVLPSGNNPRSGSGWNTDPSTDSFAGMNTLGVGIANSNAFQALQRSKTPSTMRVQNKASSRSHTRQPGVQQSATHANVPFPNIGNSTIRSPSYN